MKAQNSIQKAQTFDILCSQHNIESLTKPTKNRNKSDLNKNRLISKCFFLSFT